MVRPSSSERRTGFGSCVSAGAVLALALVFVSPSVRAQELVGHWKLDGNTFDDTAAENDGIETGGAVTYVDDRDGNPEQAARFDGAAQIVQTGANSRRLQPYEGSP